MYYIHLFFFQGAKKLFVLLYGVTNALIDIQV